MNCVMKGNFSIFLWPGVVHSVFMIMKNSIPNAESKEVSLIFDVQLIHTLELLL